MSSQQNEKSNALHYVVYAILIIFLSISAYFNFLPKEAPIEIKAEVEKCEKLEDLPADIQLEYATKEDFENLKNILADISGQKQKLQEEMDFFKHQERTENEIVQKQNTVMVKDFAKCYNMDVGSYIIDYTCKKNILTYINKYKDAKYFEIIGIVDDIEFKLYKNLENNDFLYENLGITKNTIAKMKKLSESGLAKHRTIEASWLIKSNASVDALTYSTNYHILSKDNKRGVLVRAYK
ncbi:hypothetical protein KKG72_11435 [bacterium]|nr:hypothetical protein [bacterium]MBU1994696.1 hypothetical protein [bacterium]